MIEENWQKLKNWYIGLADLLAEGTKLLVLSVPGLVLGILGFFFFILLAVKIGWWVLPTYIFLLLLSVWVYHRFIEKKKT